MDYRYRAQTGYPIIVEVINTDGEKVQIVLRPEIVDRPAIVCTTELVCPEDQPSSNSTNSTGTGRRL
jgi:hypothetical protein